MMMGPGGGSYWGNTGGFGMGGYSDVQMKSMEQQNALLARNQQNMMAEDTLVEIYIKMLRVQHTHILHRIKSWLLPRWRWILYQPMGNGGIRCRCLLLLGFR